MRDGGAKRPRCGTLGIHMNPLVVTGSLGKQIDLRLRDGGPLADSNQLANAGREFRKGFKSLHAATVAAAADQAGPSRPLSDSAKQALSAVQPVAQAAPLLQVFFNPARRNVKQAQAASRQVDVVLRVAQIAQHR